jgi:predicted  nucleic acid-binding Zn-ribbon protein
MPRKKAPRKIGHPDSTTMHPQLELLIRLHDMELMLKESEELAAAGVEVKFKLEDMEKLEEARQRLVTSIEPEHMNHYEKLGPKGRPVVPVVDGICYGCFMRLPTEVATQTERNAKVSTCMNCGRFLYWVN